MVNLINCVSNTSDYNYSKIVSLSLPFLKSHIKIKNQKGKDSGFHKHSVSEKLIFVEIMRVEK